MCKHTEIFHRCGRNKGEQWTSSLYDGNYIQFSTNRTETPAVRHRTVPNSGIVNRHMGKGTQRWAGGRVVFAMGTLSICPLRQAGDCLHEPMYTLCIGCSHIRNHLFTRNVALFSNKGLKVLFHANRPWRVSQASQTSWFPNILPAIKFGSPRSTSLIRNTIDGSIFNTPRRYNCCYPSL